MRPLSARSVRPGSGQVHKVRQVLRRVHRVQRDPGRWRRVHLPRQRVLLVLRDDGHLWLVRRATRCVCRALQGRGLPKLARQAMERVRPAPLERGHPRSVLQTSQCARIALLERGRQRPGSRTFLRVFRARWGHGPQRLRRQRTKVVECVLQEGTAALQAQAIVSIVRLSCVRMPALPLASLALDLLPGDHLTQRKFVFLVDSVLRVSSHRRRSGSTTQYGPSEEGCSGVERLRTIGRTDAS